VNNAVACTIMMILAISMISISFVSTFEDQPVKHEISKEEQQKFSRCRYTVYDAAGNAVLTTYNKPKEECE
jgi:hypothetical protein